MSSHLFVHDVVLHAVELTLVFLGTAITSHPAVTITRDNKQNDAGDGEWGFCIFPVTNVAALGRGEGGDELDPTVVQAEKCLWKEIFPTSPYLLQSFVHPHKGVLGSQESKSSLLLPPCPGFF